LEYKYKKTDFQYIDAHSHFFPPKLFEAIWKYWDAHIKQIAPDWNIKYKMPIDEMVSFLRERNISRFTTLNYAHKAGVAEELNEWTKNFCLKNPESIPFCSVYPGDKNCYEYVEKALTQDNFLGIKLQLLVTDFYLLDERMLPIYELIQELEQKIVVLHIGTGPVGSPYVGYKYFEKFMRKFPDIKVQVAHFGGFEYKKFLTILQEYAEIYFDTTMIFIEENVFDDEVEKSLGGIDDVKLILEEHKDKILWGTDFPNIPYDYDSAKDSLLRFDLSKDFYTKVFFTNAKKLYNL